MIPPWAPVLADGGLRLRGHTREDLAAVVDQCADRTSRRWTTVPVPYDLTHAEAFVATRPTEWAAGRHLDLAVELDGRFAGTVGLHPDGAGAAEVGYGLAPWARGRSVVTRALRLLLPWGFDVLGLQVITWRAVAGNWPSRRVAWALGVHLQSVTVPALIVQRGTRVPGWVGWWLPTDGLQARHPWFEAPELVAAGVRLRAHRDDDAAAMAEACADPLTQRWLPNLPAPYTRDDAREHLHGIAESRASGRGLAWAVTAAGEDALLAEVALTGELGEGTAELGYWAHPAARGRGLVTGAVRLAARHALLPVEDGGLGLRRVLIRAATGNIASQLVALRAGFSPSGIDRDAERLRDGTVQDLHRFDIVATQCP